MDFSNITTLLQDNSTLALIGVAIGAVGVQHKLVQWLSIQKGWVKQLITVFFSLCLAVFPALIGWVSANQTLPYFTAILSVMTVFYNLVVKPGSTVLAQSKAYKAAATPLVTTTVVNQAPDEADLAQFAIKE